MINTSKLKGRIVEMKTTIGKIALEMNMSGYTLGRKINNESPMSLDEANQLQRILDIPDSEFKPYFFME